MAWRIEYRWNGSNLPVSGLRVPNSSRVLALGVAVNAKKLRLGGMPRAATARASASSTGSVGTATSPMSSASATVSSCSSVAPMARRRSLAASPVCEEWASSTITA